VQMRDEPQASRVSVLFGRVLAALALASEAVQQLADGLDENGAWETTSHAWPGLKDCFLSDLDGIGYNLSTARAQVHGMSPYGADTARPADLSDVPSRWLERFAAVPGGPVLLAVLQAQRNFTRAIETALAVAPDLNEDVKDELVLCLRVCRRAVDLVGGDLENSLPPIVSVIADTLDGLLPGLLGTEGDMVSPDVTLCTA